MIDCAPLPASASDHGQCDEEMRNWQSPFHRILPTVRSQARFAFRYLADEAREEAIQETVCHALWAYIQLFRRGRAELVKPSRLAAFAIRHCRGGREFGQRRNSQDVLSTYARRREMIRVESLHVTVASAGSWADVLVEDATVTPAELAASRIDYLAFLGTLDPRPRQIAETLATGETTLRTAKLFGESPTRICQFRHEFRVAWNQFVGNLCTGTA